MSQLPDFEFTHEIEQSRNTGRRAVLAVATMLGLGVAGLATANSSEGPIIGDVAVAVGANDQVCGPLDSGKIDINGNIKTVTISAPAGFLIDQYCVKAGSANQGLGPQYVNVEPPVKSLTISHTSGKDLSHYSLGWTEKTNPTTTTTTTDVTTTTEATTTTTTTTVPGRVTTTTAPGIVTTTTAPNIPTTSTPERVTTTTTVPGQTTTTLAPPDTIAKVE